jgi:hypothetical protein
MVALSLMPGELRGPGGPIPILRLPLVRLNLALEHDNYKVYEAELQTVDGEETLKSEALRSRNEGGRMMVSWRIPAQAVQPGYYVVELKGRNDRGKFEHVESYSFRVLAR